MAVILEEGQPTTAHNTCRITSYPGSWNNKKHLKCKSAMASYFSFNNSFKFK